MFGLQDARGGSRSVGRHRSRLSVCSREDIDWIDGILVDDCEVFGGGDVLERRGDEVVLVREVFI